MAAQLRQIAFRQTDGALMEILDNVGGLFTLVVTQLYLLQELIGHSLQSIIWPGLKLKTKQNYEQSK